MPTYEWLHGRLIVHEDDGTSRPGTREETLAMMEQPVNEGRADDPNVAAHRALGEVIRRHED